jgi:transcriptional regulator, araC-type
MQPLTRQDYLRGINRVVEYINNHLDEPLSLEILASESCFSPFHFHRIFKAFIGETVGSYIQRVRLETAVHLLRYSELPIETIASHIGYEMPSSLSKAFKNTYGISPSEYRKRHDLQLRPLATNNEIIRLKPPKIAHLSSQRVLYVHATGAYAEINYAEQFAILWEQVRVQRLYTAGIELIGLYYDCPTVTEADYLRTDLCLTIHKPAIPRGEVGVKEIDGGQYAVFLYRGPYQKLQCAYNFIFKTWLPDSRCVLRNLPVFEKFLSNARYTPPEKTKTEIYVPIERN